MIKKEVYRLLKGEDGQKQSGHHIASTPSLSYVHDANVQDSFYDD